MTYANFKDAHRIVFCLTATYPDIKFCKFIFIVYIVIRNPLNGV